MEQDLKLLFLFGRFKNKDDACQLGVVSIIDLNAKDGEEIIEDIEVPHLLMCAEYKNKLVPEFQEFMNTLFNNNAKLLVEVKNKNPIMKNFSQLVYNSKIKHGTILTGVICDCETVKA